MNKFFTTFCIMFACNAFSQTPNWILFDHTNSPIINDSITWVEVDTSNVKWIGTRNGLYSFDNNTWTAYNTSNSNIPTNRIDKFKIAYDNTIWFLNNNNGFIKFKNNSFTLYNKTNLPTLTTDSLVGLTIDSNDVFFWSDYNGISKFNSVTNSVYNIDTANSYLKNIETLVYHSNHTLYGKCFNPMIVNGGGPLQNKADSIKTANNFMITNTPTISISYCFLNIFTPCDYERVTIDKFHNRFEDYFQSYGPSPQQYRRIFDLNNNIVSNQIYNSFQEYQILNSNYGSYKLVFNGGLDIFYFTIYSPALSGGYGHMNASILDSTIINLDSDKYNNIWFATLSGLVGYNDQALITGIDKVAFPNINIYPNPTNSSLNIEIKEDIKELRIYNYLGEEVMFKTFNTKSIDVNDLINGVYFIEVKTIDGIIRHKFIKE